MKAKLVPVGLEEFLNSGLERKTALFDRGIHDDPKQVAYVALQWRDKNRFDQLVAQFYLAKSLRLVKPDLADKEAVRCIVLTDGLNLTNQITSDGKSIWLPSSFAEEFSHLMSFANQFWTSSASMKMSYAPVISFQERNDLQDRVSFSRAQTDIGFWPISFASETNTQDGCGYSLTRDEIASVLRHV